MVAPVAVNAGILVNAVTFTVKDKCFSIDFFYVAGGIFLFFFNMAFITPDRPAGCISMTFYAEPVKVFGTLKPLVTVGAFFYPFVIVTFMMTVGAGYFGLIVHPVRHFNTNCCFKSFKSFGHFGSGQIIIYTGDCNNVSGGLIIIIRA